MQRAERNPTTPIIANPEVIARVELVSRNLRNRAVVRLVLACALAKAHQPSVDIRKPYTEIGSADAFSGRRYDEQYVEPFIFKHNLPCNPTTAFLTPALRNRNATLTPDTNLVGRPANVYTAALQLRTDVHEGRIAAADLLAETVRWLLVVRDEQRHSLEAKLANLRATVGMMPLSAEGIITLIEQHLRLPGSSRLPVLIVAAAYKAAANQLGERTLPLESHHAADRQTGSIGDLQITLVDDDHVISGYEMKMRQVTQGDIDNALPKIAGRGVQNYIFITTAAVDPAVQDYAAAMYERTGGVEIAILDCVSFLRHFLHLFHRRRDAFVEAYQNLVLAEPDSAVGQPLKEAWLSLRVAAESDTTSSAEAVS